MTSLGQNPKAMSWASCGHAHHYVFARRFDSLLRYLKAQSELFIGFTRDRVEQFKKAIRSSLPTHLTSYLRARKLYIMDFR